MEFNSKDNNSHDSKLLNCMLLHRPSILLLHLKDPVESSPLLGKELNIDVWILMFSLEKKDKLKMAL